MRTPHQLPLFAGPAKLDPSEAPPGYFAVLKSDVVTPTLGNICRACDWRHDCRGDTYRCMSYVLVNGLKRNDGCSVVFKRSARTAAAASLGADADAQKGGV